LKFICSRACGLGIGFLIHKPSNQAIVWRYYISRSVGRTELTGGNHSAFIKKINLNASYLMKRAFSGHWTIYGPLLLRKPLNIEEKAACIVKINHYPNGFTLFI